MPRNRQKPPRNSTEVRAYRIRLVREPQAVFDTPSPLTTPHDAAALLRRHLRGADRECFVCIALNTRHRPIGMHTVSVGTVDTTVVHPREVFKFAIHVGATAVILGHNHPSGDPTPGPDDHTVTRRLLEAGSLLGIKVLDHVIVTENGFVSMRESSAQLAFS